MQGIPERKGNLDRIFHILVNSDFLRHQEGEKKGELQVSEEKIREISSFLRCYRFAPGEIVFRQGETGKSCYIVASGRIRGQILYAEKGKKYTSEFKLEPFSLFGEMSLFTGMPRTATCIVEKESELLEIKASDFALFLDHSPKLAEMIAELVSQRNQKNRAFLEKIKELSEKDIQECTSKHSILTRLKSFIKRET